MTTAALVEPMLEILGISPLAAFLACGTGALMFKHSNSSGFWVTTSMSNMTLTQGIISVGGFSTVCWFCGGCCDSNTLLYGSNLIKYIKNKVFIFRKESVK